jgi:hypothetical protein
MARRAWILIAVGTAIYWGWLIAGSAIFAEDEPSAAAPLALALLPLAVGAGITIAAAAAGARDPARRAERMPFRVAAVAGLLELVTVVWGYVHDLTGSDSGAYALPLVLATFTLPVAAAWAASVRRFSRHPEAVREPVDVRLRRGWVEQTKSWTLMWRHRGLLVFPVSSTLLVTAAWIGTYRLTGLWAFSAFLILLPASLTTTYFGVAYLAALDCRLRGHRGALRDGLRIAWRRRTAIAGWAVLAAGVGAVIQGLQQLKSEWAIAPLLSWIAGIAWALLTIFVMPVLALEDRGVRGAVRRAGELVRQRWGEAVGGLGNLMLVSAVAMVPFGLAWGVAVAIAAPDPTAMNTVFVVGIACFLALLVPITATWWTLALALYHYATGGGPIQPFTEDDLQHALVRRRRLWRRRRS